MYSTAFERQQRSRRQDPFKPAPFSQSVAGYYHVREARFSKHLVLLISSILHTTECNAGTENLIQYTLLLLPGFLCSYECKLEYNSSHLSYNKTG